MSPAVLLVLYGLLPWLLATPWARNRVTAGVERRLGLETTIGRLGWSPWTGLEVHRLRMGKPAGLDAAPLLELRRVRIWPDYSSWFGDRRRIRGMEVVGAALELDLEGALPLSAPGRGKVEGRLSITAPESIETNVYSDCMWAGTRTIQ